jgi:hypothetical protein
MKKDLLKSKKNNTTAEKKYSSIQYFFWLLSGCEINILKDCPTDYNRQAGIGFTVFMTTVLAFCSGGYAGWYFGESKTTAIVFGLLWSALIFSIDRSMVVTLKKDPTIKEQKFWAPLLSRGIMALLIAFIISIPLELLIFQENIELHMEKYKLDQTFAVQQAAIRNEAVTDKERILKRDSINALLLKNELAIGEPGGDPIYNNLKSDYNEKNNQYQSLLSSFNKANAESNRAYNNVPLQYNSNNKDLFSNEWKVYQKKLNVKNSTRKNLNNFNISALNKAKNDKANYLNDWITKKNNNKNDLDASIKNQVTNISNSIKKADTIKGGFENNIKDKNGFVLRFMILEDLATRYRKVRKQRDVEIIDSSTVTIDSLANSSSASLLPLNDNSNKKTEWTEEEEYNPEGATIFFLLWLIRLLFFTIEILPTIAKIATPLGAYDIAIYRKEREIEEDLEKRTEDHIKQQKVIRELENNAQREQIIAQNKIENELHAGILTEIASAQNDLAKKQIEDFRKKHLN